MFLLWSMMLLACGAEPQVSFAQDVRARDAVDSTAQVGRTPESSGSLLLDVHRWWGGAFADAPMSICQVAPHDSWLPGSTDDRGRAWFDDLPPGMYRIYRLDDGDEVDVAYAPVSPGDRTRVQVGGWPRWNLHVVGHVRRGAELERWAHVCARRARWPRDASEVDCDATALFGRYGVRLTERDVYEFQIRPLDLNGADVSYRARRSVTEESSAIDLDLPPGEVSGRVVDDRGRPIGDASVQIERREPLRDLASADCIESARTTTDRQGRFWLGPIPLGTNWLRAESSRDSSVDGRRRSSWKSFRIDLTARQPSMHELICELPDAARVTGIVLDVDQTPLSDTRVFARRIDEPSFARHVIADTDDQGRFETFVPIGDIEFWSERGIDRLNVAPRIVRHIDSARSAPLEMTCTRGSAIRIQGVDDEGTPLALRVCLLDASAHVSRCGEFLDEIAFTHRTDCLSTGTYQVVGCDFRGKLVRARVDLEVGQQQDVTLHFSR